MNVSKNTGIQSLVSAEVLLDKRRVHINRMFINRNEL